MVEDVRRRKRWIFVGADLRTARFFEGGSRAVGDVRPYKQKFRGKKFFRTETGVNAMRFVLHRLYERREGSGGSKPPPYKTREMCFL